jgi:hypothetical protein
MTPVRMTTLRTASNGDWLARKMIPEDVRDAYKAKFGVKIEARFREPRTTPEGRAKQTFREWDAEITARIERLRAEARGEGIPSITQRQARSLAGQWYTWFIRQHEDDAGHPDDWALTAAEYEAALSSGSGILDERDFDPEYAALCSTHHCRGLVTAWLNR